MIEIEKNIRTFLNQLISHYPQIKSIWLFGSRANHMNRIDSDWDFLIFANQELLDSLEKNPSLKLQNVHLLVVFNNNDFKDPWCKQGGSLTNWKWEQISPKRAKYWEIKWLSDGRLSEIPDAEEGEFQECERIAIKIWPYDSHS